ncbi:MAG: isoleucine--tRNA ligase [Limnochordaceae bacterium]|nr:isoleucine--tRNA ligase [Limnochordaceae bacterium]
MDTEQRTTTKEQKGFDYQATVHLPKTDFPMKANLAQREPGMLEAWDKAGYYQQLQKQGAEEGRPLFVLHDGPPYANGHIHIGTALNKVLKDVVVRSRSMAGYRAPYVPGWDTHGLPIEQRVIQDLGLDRHAVSELEFRRRCREYALGFVDTQRQEFRRLGVWGDWQNPYLTLRPEYEAAQIRVFGEMARKGYIYKGLKPVYWCAHCETALAEAEIEYTELASPSIYLRFPILPPTTSRQAPLLNGGERVPGSAAAGRIPSNWAQLYRPGHTYVLVWTTTPWTLPADEAVALHPELEYVLVEVSMAQDGAAETADRYLLARGLLSSVASTLGWPSYQELGHWLGRELEPLVARRPLSEEQSPFILGEHVTLEQGTGVVHTAPGHGLEDYEVGTRYDLPVFAPVDDHGRFTAAAGPYSGLELGEANEVIIRDLQASGILLHEGQLTHQYPLCWRCKNPVIFRATEQWFASVDGFRQAALDAIRKVRWIPAWGEDRIHNMIEERHDWCISRQRVWGVPIPAFYCTSCGHALITEETIEAVARLFQKEGSDAWWAHSAAEILPPGTVCPQCGGHEFRKERDIMDVWFDSGSSHAGVLAQRPELAWPADLYLEGSDQHRGWFQSSLLTAVATRGQAPYRSVLTHGFIVDGEGRKMSKSLGNVVSPDAVTKKYGADILRLWASSADYRGDIRVSEPILGQMAEVYRRVRNTARFILGNLADFDPRHNAVDSSHLEELDRWALQRVNRFAQRLRKAYDEYEFHMVFHGLHDFCAVDMGAFYLDVLKDRLYTDARNSPRRRSAQTALFRLLQILDQMMAPVLVFTADEIWEALRRLPGTTEVGVLGGEPLRVPSVHLSRWPEPVLHYLTPAQEQRWERLLAVRREVTRGLEEARAAGQIGGSLEALVTLTPTSEEMAVWLASWSPTELADLFIVSGVEVQPVNPTAAAGAGSGAGVTVTVSAHPGQRCARCWKRGIWAGDPHHPELCSRCVDALRQDGTYQ